jgi:hypothetical protein
MVRMDARTSIQWPPRAHHMVGYFCLPSLQSRTVSTSQVPFLHCQVCFLLASVVHPHLNQSFHCSRSELIHSIIHSIMAAEKSFDAVEDYYTTDMVSEIWKSAWYENMFRNGQWASGLEPVNPIPPIWQSYHPYACHACKRGSLTKTKLLTCTGCRVVKYCSREHQKSDWPAHKALCKGFAKLSIDVDMRSYANREAWHSSLQYVTGLLRTKMSGLLLHSANIQIAIMQPRCRKCFKAGSDPSVILSTCPRCGGVALCKECHDTSKGEPIQSGWTLLDTAEASKGFHHDSNDPTAECDNHLLSVCCLGLVVEQGNPLGLPSNSDEKKYWNPSDWRQYFARKRIDYELPPQFFDMAPVPAFLSDSHSTVLTIQHILSLPELCVDAPSLTKMVIHICGAGVNDEMMPGRYVEMIRINPALTDLSLHLIGPKVEDIGNLYETVIGQEKVRSSCTVSIKNHKGLYHEIFEQLEEPTIVFCPQSGMVEPSYTATWRPTIELLSARNIPFVLTGYNHQEVKDDTALLRKWGANIIIPPKPNPFRGLRPFLDPGREGSDHIFSNASFVVAKGKAGR